MLELLKFKKSLFSGALDGGQDEVFLGGTRLKRFMQSVEKVSDGSPTPEHDSCNPSDDRPLVVDAGNKEVLSPHLLQMQGKDTTRDTTEEKDMASAQAANQLIVAGISFLEKFAIVCEQNEGRNIFKSQASFYYDAEPNPKCMIKDLSMDKVLEFIKEAKIDAKVDQDNLPEFLESLGLLEHEKLICIINKVPKALCVLFSKMNCLMRVKNNIKGSNSLALFKNESACENF